MLRCPPRGRRDQVRLSLCKQSAPGVAGRRTRAFARPSMPIADSGALRPSGRHVCVSAGLRHPGGGGPRMRPSALSGLRTKPRPGRPRRRGVAGVSRQRPWMAAPAGAYRDARPSGRDTPGAAWLHPEPALVHSLPPHRQPVPDATLGLIRATGFRKRRGQAAASSGLTRNQAAYSAGRNSRVSAVATISPPMIATAIEP